MSGSLIIEIIKVGSVTMMGKIVTKAIGEKEISEIIAGVGLTVVSVDALCLLAPVCKFISGIGDKASNVVLFFDKASMFVDKIIHLGG